MKRNPLIFLSLCILCMACDNRSENTTSLKTHEKRLEQGAGRYLTYDDILVLERVSHKTLDRIRKGQVLEFSDIVSMQHSGIQPDTMIQVLLFTESKFNLTTVEIIQLQSEGVPFKVINFMIRT